MASCVKCGVKMFVRVRDNVSLHPFLHVMNLQCIHSFSINILPVATIMIQHYTHNITLCGTLTHACDPISSVSLVTGTGEATRSVGTGSIGAGSVYIWANQYLIYLQEASNAIERGFAALDRVTCFLCASLQQT